MSTAILTWKIPCIEKEDRTHVLPLHRSPFSTGGWTLDLQTTRDLLRVHWTGASKESILQLNIGVDLVDAVNEDGRSYCAWITSREEMAECQSSEDTQDVMCRADFSGIPLPKSECEEDKRYILVDFTIVRREGITLPPTLHRTLFGEAFNDVWIEVDRGKRSLSASSLVLQDKSPYFESQLKAGFAESTERGKSESIVKPTAKANSTKAEAEVAAKAKVTESLTVEARLDEHSYEDSDEDSGSEEDEDEETRVRKRQRLQDEKHFIKLHSTS